MEAYLLSIKTGINGHGKPSSKRSIWEAINYLRYFLEYLEHIQVTNNKLLLLN